MENFYLAIPLAFVSPIYALFWIAFVGLSPAQGLSPSDNLPVWFVVFVAAFISRWFSGRYA